jgi:hypothetical protein
MRLPQFTAGAGLYVSKCNYTGKELSTLGGGNLRPQITPPSVHTFVTCDLAQALCILNSHGSGFDPSGWCAWYEANCLAGPSSPPGGGGDDGGGGVHHGPAHT